VRLGLGRTVAFYYLLILFIPESLTYSVLLPLFLKRQCDRTLGGARACANCAATGAKLLRCAGCRQASHERHCHSTLPLPVIDCLYTRLNLASVAVIVCQNDSVTLGCHQAWFCDNGKRCLKEAWKSGRHSHGP
jgi:hypothetical protein